MTPNATRQAAFRKRRDAKLIRMESALRRTLEIIGDSATEKAKAIRAVVMDGLAK